MNSQTTPVTSTILRNKLSRTAIRLQQQANPRGTKMEFNTLEKAVSESMKLLSQFYKNLSKPGFTPSNVVVDSVPDAETFNNNMLGISDDLHVVFNEFENLEGVILGSFNYMVSRLNKLNRKMKQVSSSLGDYVLFSRLPTKDAIFFGDSFNNLSRVEVNSPLLNNEQCEVNQVEGIATLPVDRNAQVSINISEVPVINSNSNGVSGNNQELNAQLHNTISDILDNNADTWFEYERVITSDDGIDLVFDFTVNIGEAKIVNFVRVNPNNFGTRTQVEIVAIDTSIDGKSFVSIKDDIPIADFTVEDEENVFTLAPSTSKFAGQGLYSFTPRKAKYFHFTLKQTTPYIITSTSGADKYRYAVGVRDIDIQALPYKEKGELISTEYSAGDDIRKVVVLSNQSPVASTTSQLASIDHYISPDNGVTWHQIRPFVSEGEANVDQAVPELLDFNGVAEDSIKTNNDVRTLRYKAVLSRSSDAFKEGVAELAQELDEITELHAPPTTTPFEIALQKTPIDSSLYLVDPQFGSRGKEEAKYQIALGTGGKLNILLPFKPLVRDYEKVYASGVWTLADSDPEQVYVDGNQWTRGALAGSNNRYKLNYEEGRLEFGDGTDGNAVRSGASVAMTLSEERLFPSRGASHRAYLDYPTSNDKKQMEVYLVKPPESKTIVLKKGATRHPLLPDIISSGSPYNISISDSTVFNSREDFIDGSSELASTPGNYSIDYTNGVMYSYSPTSTSTETTITFFYNPRTLLNEDDWQFGNDTSVIDSILISDQIYETFDADTYTVPTGVTYFNLEHMGVVRGTLSFDDSGVVPSGLSQEVDYIDGRSELLGVIQATEQLDTITGITPGQTLSIPFKMKISSDNGFSVSFTNQSVFANEQSSKGAVDSGATGYYWIDRTYTTSSTGRIYVKLAGNVSSPGKVSYHYVDPRANLTGRFSVNYEHGEVFTTASTDSGLTADYEYTDYRARYDIARVIPSTDWEHDASSNKITIKDREILRNIRTPQATPSTGGSKFYQVVYQYVKSTREDVEQLEPFFSPVLKDYALKIITKSRLI